MTFADIGKGGGPGRVKSVLHKIFVAWYLDNFGTSLSCGMHDSVVGLNA